MNEDFEAIKAILVELRSDYSTSCQQDAVDPFAPITERDIVAEIYCRLRGLCRMKGLHVHCEIKPATNENIGTDQLKRLPKIDVGILAERNGRSWLTSAIKLQDKIIRGGT